MKTDPVRSVFTDEDVLAETFYREEKAAPVDRLAAPLQHTHRALRSTRGRPPAREANAYAVGGDHRSDDGAVGNGITVNGEEFHGTPD